MAGAPHIIAALRHLRAEQRGHGTERQDGRVTLFALAEEARAECLPFICKERPRNLFKATPGTSFMLVTALVPERTKGCVSGSHGVKPRGFESHPMY